MENIFWQVAIILLGLFVGSFLNVAILRMEKDEKDWFKLSFKSRSRCPHCKKTLAFYDLIPVLSFLFLAGKCRYCKKPISLQYPLVEAATGLLFYLIFQKFGLSWHLIFLLPLVSILVILFVYDLKTLTIPDIITYIGIGLAIAYTIFNFSTQGGSFGQFSIFNFLIAPLIAGGFFALLVFISRETWMGRGDIKIGILMGFLLGYPNVLVALFLAFTIGALVSAILLGIKKKTLKSQVPFGPFLIAATFIAFFWGEKMLQWYLGMM